MDKGSRSAVSISLAAILAFPLTVSVQQLQDPVDPEEIRATMKTMWSLAVASDAYQFDYGTYPKVVTVQELIEIVKPLYLPSRELSAIDAWGNPILVRSTGEDLEIRSMGSDGQIDDGVPQGMCDNTECDILIVSGDFFQYPAEFCVDSPPCFCEPLPNLAIPADRDPRERGSRPLNSNR